MNYSYKIQLHIFQRYGPALFTMTGDAFKLNA